jgi:hypothetical protein
MMASTMKDLPFEIQLLFNHPQKIASGHLDEGLNEV